MTQPSINALVVLDHPDLIDVLAREELVTLEEMHDAAAEYHKFLMELNAEWPPARIKEWRLEKMRARYADAARYLQKLELDNRDARVQGVSYKMRKTFTAKIKGGHQFVHEIKAEGEAIKRAPAIEAKDLVKPSDIPAILKHGFEKHLEYAVF